MHEQNVSHATSISLKHTEEQLWATWRKLWSVHWFYEAKREHRTMLYIIFVLSHITGQLILRCLPQWDSYKINSQLTSVSVQTDVDDVKMKLSQHWHVWFQWIMSSDKYVCLYLETVFYRGVQRTDGEL